MALCGLGHRGPVADPNRGDGNQNARKQLGPDIVYLYHDRSGTICAALRPHRRVSMRVVCGRLKSDYRYSNTLVYNNFPWPTPTEEQKAKIERTARAILDARALYPDCSLADLYDETVMPPELRTAHQNNDRAVMQAYGFDVKSMTESSCVAALMKLYIRLVEQKG